MVVDKLSKATHCILVKSTYKEIHIEDIFLTELFKLHRIPKVFIYDRDIEFIENFWEAYLQG